MPESAASPDSSRQTAQEPQPPRFPWIGRKPFYGWVIVIIGGVTQFFQGIASQGFATYLGPLQTEFGWSKAVLSGPRSVTQIEGAVTGPLEGHLVDRLGPRKVVTAGIFIMGLGFILFGITNSLWMYYVSSMVIALGMGLEGLLVMSVTVNNWFRRKRTIAQALMGLGYSLAGAVGVLALVYVQEKWDWRASAIGAGLLIWVVGFPFATLLRSRPESVGQLPDGGRPRYEGPSGKGNPVAVYGDHSLTLAQAMRARSFWILAAVSAIGNLGLLAGQLHLFLHLEQGVGLTKTTAALVWTVASVSNIPARLAGGFFGDRFPKAAMLGLSMAFMAVAIYVLAIATSARMAFAYAVIFGIGWGMRTPIINAIQGEYFGGKSQGVIRGWLQSLSLPITIAAPVIVGLMADRQGTYTPVFTGMAAVMLFGSVLALLATQPKAPR